MVNNFTQMTCTSTDNRCTALRQVQVQHSISKTTLNVQITMAESAARLFHPSAVLWL